MKKMIKRILKESITKKEYVKIFDLIDKVLSKNRLYHKDDLIGDNFINSNNAYEFVYDYLVDNAGYDSEDANKIIGSYILTNQHNKDSGDEYKKDVLVAKPKKYVGEFSQYISGYQRGHMTTGKDTYSKPEAFNQFNSMNYDDWTIVDDNTESTDFDINDVWEDND